MAELDIAAGTAAGALGGAAAGGGTRRDWAVAAAIIALATTAVLLMFHDLVGHAVGLWIRSQVFNHCFAIVPLSGYMIWQRRDWLLRHQPRPQWSALWLMLPIGGFYLLARFAAILELQEHAVMAMLQVLFLAVLGWPAYRALAWPLLYLFFLVPSGEFLVPKLQEFTAWFSVGLLQLAQVPVWSDGNFITIASGNFEVAEACAGVRFLIASLAFGALYADVMYRSPWRRAGFLLTAAVVPVIANGFRAFGIVYLAHLTGNAAAVEADHLIYGWVFFSFVMLLLILIGNRFREDDRPFGDARAVLDAAPSAPLLQSLAAAIMVVALAAAPAAWAGFVEARPAPLVAAALDGLAATSPWRPVPVGSGGWLPRYPGADLVARRSFSDGRRRVDLYIAYFTRQGPGKKLIGGDVRWNDDGQWRRLGGGEATASLADTGLRPITERYGRYGGFRRIWYLYWVDGSFAASGTRAKLLQAMAELKGGGRGSAVVAIAADAADEDGKEAQAALADFAAHLAPLQPLLQRLAGRP